MFVFCAADIQARIVGGQDATGEYPYIVSLQKDNSHFCGGSIIKADWILTAGHCVKAGEIAGNSALAGTKEKTPPANSPIQRANFVQVIVHENYKPTDIGAINDIAIVQVSPAFNLVGAVGKIELETAFIDAGVQAEIIGYGYY